MFEQQQLIMDETCSVLPMWLLCDDALVSCPQRDTIQMVSSSALLHMLCRSLFRILQKTDRQTDTINHFGSHEELDVPAGSLGLRPTSS